MRTGSLPTDKEMARVWMVSAFKAGHPSGCQCQTCLHCRAMLLNDLEPDDIRLLYSIDELAADS